MNIPSPELIVFTFFGHLESNRYRRALSNYKTLPEKLTHDKFFSLTNKAIQEQEEK